MIVRDTIPSYATPGTVSYWTEESKVEYLNNTVAGFEWAKVPLTHCFAQEPPRNFHRLFTALDTCWLQEQRKKTISRTTKKDTTDIFWESQRMYRAPKRYKRNEKPYPKYNQEPLHIIKCYNCNEKGNFSWQCSNPKNMTKRFRKLLKNTQKSKWNIIWIMKTIW